MSNNIRYTKENNPWFSFRPYKESDTNNFKGRGKDITEVMKYITGNKFVVCYAKSGIGKSSLINAGLMPRLRRKLILPISIRFTEDFFNSAFEENIRTQINVEIQQLNKTAKNNARDEIYSIEKHEDVTTNPLLSAIDAELTNKSIWWWLNTHQIICKRGEFPIEYQPILIFDQFEELFQKTETERQREQFFKWLYEMSLTRPSDAIQKVIENIQQQDEYKDIYASLPQNCGWKIMLSVREDYVGMLDYWCTQRICIPAAQENRYCLMPLTAEQAEEVITQQTIGEHRVDILDKYKQAIINSLMDTDGVPAVLLSVLCNKIYDEEISGGTHTAQRLQYMTSNENISDEAVRDIIHSLIRSVYEERVRNSKISKRRISKIEQVLVRDNGTRRRIELGELSDSVQHTCQRLADSYLVRIEDFGEKNGTKIQYVEIIHDRVAEVIAEKRHEINKKYRVFWSRCALVAGIVFLFGFTYWNQLWTYNENKAKQFPYMELRDTCIQRKASDVDWYVSNLYALQTLKCDNEKKINNGGYYCSVYNCPNITTIDANEYNADFFCLTVSNCNNLRHINLNKSIKNLSLNISGASLIKPIEIPDSIDSLDIRSSSEQISFKIPNNNMRYRWSDGVLWDMKNDTILYARSDASYDITVPYKTHKKKYIYSSRVFSVQNASDQILTLLKKAENDNKIDTINMEIKKDVDSVDLSTFIITEIPAQFFKNFKNLQYIKLPSTLKRIGYEAFEKCDSLKIIEFDKYSNVTIGEKAFADCKNLLKVQFPDSVTIMFYAFKNCNLLEDVYFGEYASLPATTFSKCIALKNVKLPSHGNFTPDVFNDCINIENFDYDDVYWTTADDGTIFHKQDTLMPIGNTYKVPLTLTNNVKYHTFENDVFYSKKGNLYIRGNKSIAYNEPITNIQENVVFYMNGKSCINNSENITTLFLPIQYGFPKFLREPINLQELHLPCSNPNYYSRIEESIPDSIQENIMLYVPYGCSQYFKNNLLFKNFKDIKEETLCSTLWTIIKYHFKTGLSLIDSISFWIMIVLIVIIATIVLARFMFYKKCKEEGSVTDQEKWTFIFKALSTSVLGPCIWYVFYWFLFLAVLPLLPLPLMISYSKFYYISIAIIAGVLSLLSIYLLLYSDGFNFNKLHMEAKKNVQLLQQILTNTYKNPKRSIKVLLLVLSPFFIYAIVVQYNEYKEERLRNATNSINEKLSYANQNPDDALEIYYDAWNKNYNTIKGKDIENILYGKAYSTLIKDELLEIWFSNISSYHIVPMPDGNVLFTDGYNKSKTCVLQAKNDTIHLIEDYCSYYRFDNSGRYLVNMIHGANVMDMTTRQIDTLTIGYSYYTTNFHPNKPVLAYKEEDYKIHFYDMENKKNIMKPITSNHKMFNFCYDKDGDIIETNGDTIFTYHWDGKIWNKTYYCLNNKWRHLLTPIYINKDMLSVQNGDSLIVWSDSKFGKNERYWEMFSHISENSFSQDRKYAITYKDKKLRVLDLSESNKHYDIELPNDCRDACFADDGKYIYAILKDTSYYMSVIIRFPFLLPEQVYEILKEKYNGGKQR